MNVINRTFSRHLFSCSKEFARMQSSITMFFKAKQPPNQRSPNNSSDTNGDDKEQNVPAKRTAEDLDTENTPNKRIAVESDSKTPKKVETHKDDVTSPQAAKPPILSHQVKSVASPLMDITALIRTKISSGAFALHENIGKSWFKALSPEFDKPYFRKLSSFVQQERRSKTVFPPEDKVYTWTRFHEIRDTRVIILGQDPYHGPGQAHGLSFSVQKGVRIPPSLVNIFKELESDIPGFVSPNSGDLTGWARQGVLLLNTCLTVNQGAPNSHQGKGWETFTDAVIKWISQNMKHNVVFILWGRPAQRKMNLIDKRHKIYTSVHPSPLSCHGGFFGSSHFSMTNDFLREQGLPEIDWKAL